MFSIFVSIFIINIYHILPNMGCCAVRFLNRSSIKRNIMTIYITTTLVTFAIVYYVLFSNWISTADGILSTIAKDMNQTIYGEFEGFVKLPQYLNEVTENQIRNGVLDFDDETIRDKFFVGLLSAHGSTPIYSISIGTEKGEYYGARRNKDNNVEIMKNNTDTGGKSRYYKVREDMTAGELVVETGRFDPRTRPWYKAAKESGKTSFSPLYKHFVLDDLTVSVGTPVYDKEGSLIGVLGTHITLSRMDQYLNDIVKRNGASAVIVDKNTGELVANSLQIPNFKVDADGSLKMTGINEINNSSIIRGYENYLANNDEDHVVVNGESSHINISEFKTTGVDMLLITSIPDAILTRDIYETIRLTIIFSTIIMLTLSFLYISYVGNLLKPLESLNLSAKKLNDGNFDERAKIFREDEIGKLAATFNMLAATIGSHVEDLETKVKDRTEDLEATNTVLQENREQLKLILDSTAEGIYGMDTEGLCTFCNESALRMLGYSSQEELLGKNMHFQIHHTRRDGTPFPLSECKIMESFKNGRGVYVDDEIFWRKDGTFFDVRYSSYPQYRDGKMVGSVITFMDNTERKKNEEHIKYLTYHDPLTNINNRLFFEEQIPVLDTEDNLPISVIFGDLNGLKLTNDIFGHAAGDRLLTEAAAAFKKASGNEGLAARIGGDEFALIMPNTDADRAKDVIEEIRKSFSNENSNDIIGSVSLGASTKTSAEESMHEMIEIAENLMYKDKTINRNKNNKNMIRKIINNLHNRSPREKRHSENVSVLCEKIAEEMGLSKALIKRLGENGYFHDIGKIVLEDDILNKHRDLTEEEYRKMQQHSVVGYRILNLFDDTIDLAEGVLSHHEHLDGTGYPKGIKGEEIPLSSRIIAVAEAYDAMTNDNYDRRKTNDEAVEEIIRLSGVRFDKDAVEAFIKISKKQDQETKTDQ
ncbi:MAG: sensor domain-containing diguanylate cyclase [Synergistetes bacterium HGW-Synergistetes-1]|nr:MAG: sensor domain-containing diguanylate cyclase [Synergistetes bacterium HGW-Synergistetes-1]